MSCEECRELHTHKFHTPKFLLNAVAVALGEVNRGTLKQVPIDSPVIEEQLPLASFAESTERPDIVMYCFRCEKCGQKFKLFADTYHGGGGWTQEGETDAL